jgi:hypothetical protein
VEKERKWNQDLEIIVNEDEEHHVEVHKRAWTTYLELYDGKHKMELAKKAIEMEWELVQYQCNKSKETLYCMSKNCKKECRACKGSRIKIYVENFL